METSARTWRPPQRAVAVAAALVFAGFLFSGAIRSAVFLLFGAFLLAVLLDPPVRLLSRIVRRSIAAAIVFFLIAGSAIAAVRFAVPMVLDQGAKVAKQAPESLDRVEGFWNRLRQDHEAHGVPSGEEIEDGVRGTLHERADELAKKVVPVASGVIAALSTMLLLLVIATFMVASPETYADGIVRLVPVQQERPTREFLLRVVDMMRRFMIGKLLAMSFVGVVTAIGLLVIGVKGWLALAVVNFFCEFVPFFGPVAGAVPGIAVALADSTRKAAYTAGLYLGVQQLEGILVSPLAMKQQVQLAPPVLLGWQVLMSIAFGIPGVLLATPILVVLKVAIDFFWVERTLGKEPEPQAAG